MGNLVIPVDASRSCFTWILDEVGETCVEIGDTLIFIANKVMEFVSSWQFFLTIGMIFVVAWIALIPLAVYLTPYLWIAHVTSVIGGLTFSFLSQHVKIKEKQMATGYQHNNGYDPLPLPPRVEGQPLGILNDGTTCFLSAALQFIIGYEKLKNAAQEELADYIPRHEVMYQFTNALMGSKKQAELELVKSSEFFIKLVAYLVQEKQEGILSQLCALETKSEAVKLSLGWLKVIIGQAVSKAEKREEVKVPEPFNGAVLLRFLAEDEKLKELINNEEDGCFNQNCRDKYFGFARVKACFDLLESHKKDKEPLLDNKKGLSDVRYCLPKTQRNGQQDAIEAFQSITDCIKEGKKKEFLIQKQRKKTFTKIDDKQLSENQKKALEKTAQTIAEKSKNNSNYIADNYSYYDPERVTMDSLFCLKLPLPQPKGGNEEAVNGQILLEQAFNTQPSTGEPVIYLDRDNNKPGYYLPSEEESIPNPPEQLLVELQRFSSDGKNKIDSLVDMPETVNLGGAEYQLEAIVRHISNNTQWGHYIAFTKDKQIWWECNDDRVTQPAVAKFKDAREKGYFYRYAKKPAPTKQA